nr:nucleotidyltransferase domain-containing protein [Flexivirga meconopsidis]
MLDRVVVRLQDDGRVAALWLGGSIGRGVADTGSDLDLIVTAYEPSVVAADGAVVWDFLDPVWTYEIAGMAGSFALLTRSGLRIDIVLEGVAETGSSPYVHRVVVFDRRPDPVLPQAIGAEGDRPDMARMEGIAAEFGRQLAIFPDAVVARGDWLLGQEAVHNCRRFLYELYVISNAPLPPMGVKQWSAKLTAGQQRRLSSLLPPVADRAAVVAAMCEVAAVIRAEGRALVERAGGVWPDEIVQAGLARWAARGLPDPVPGRDGNVWPWHRAVTWNRRSSATPTTSPIASPVTRGTAGRWSRVATG